MTQKIINLYHNIEKQMVLKMFITSIYLKIKTRLARIVLNKINNSEQPDPYDSISALNFILASNDFTNVSVGWNSANKPINSKFETAQDEIFELRKIDRFLNSNIDRKISSGYLEYTDKQIDICIYFKDKQNNRMDVSETIKTISVLVNNLLRSYDKIKEDKTSYEYLVISSVFEQLQKTLLSLSELK